MARTVLHTVYPFREGTDRPLSDWHFITIEHETAKSRAGVTPFRVVWHAVGLVMEKSFAQITDACAALPAEIAAMTKNHSTKTDGTPRDWSGLQPCGKGWASDNTDHDLHRRGSVNRMRADMGWSLERARAEYDADPGQRF